jgi:hypothetical protein
VETGDLLFLDWNCGPLCEAIKAVTKQQFNTEGPHMSHVGILEKDENGKISVYEAIPEAGVVKSDLDFFLMRVNSEEGVPGGFYVGRMRDEYRSLSIEAVEQAKGLLGRPYDPTFQMTNSNFYCAKLLFEVFRSANKGTPIFRTSPMKFGLPGSKSRKIWDDYYKNLNMRVPVDQPGLSPLGMFRQGQKQFFK